MDSNHKPKYLVRTPRFLAICTNNFFGHIFMIFAQIGIFGIAYLFEGNFDIFSFEPITLLWVSMTPFGAALIILLISVRFLHKIPIKNFFTSKNFFSWKYLLISAAIWFFLAVLSDVFLSFIQKDNYQFAFNAKTFFPFLFSTLLLVPIQITAEESFFRGYLQKGFTRFNKAILVRCNSSGNPFRFITRSKYRSLNLWRLDDNAFLHRDWIVIRYYYKKIPGIGRSSGVTFCK